MSNSWNETRTGNKTYHRLCSSATLFVLYHFAFTNSKPLWMYSIYYLDLLIYLINYSVVCYSEIEVSPNRFMFKRPPIFKARAGGGGGGGATLPSLCGVLAIKFKVILFLIKKINTLYIPTNWIGISLLKWQLMAANFFDGSVSNVLKMVETWDTTAHQFLVHPSRMVIFTKYCYHGLSVVRPSS